ncbi:MAG: hypothetical protein P8Z00_17685 [Anaerolineales bacterium]|jgi:hypothetical protein
MSSSNLIRWSGLSAIVGGALIVVSDVTNAVLFPGGQGGQVMLTSSWFIVQILGLIALALITLGLVGLYACQAQRAGTLGLIAFVIAFGGLLMVFGLSWGEPFLGPLVAEQAPGLLSAEPSGALAVGSILSIVLFALGWLLFGLASLRAGVLPRGAAVLLIVGALLSFILVSLDLPLWSFALGAAVIWMGYALWSGTGEPALLAEAAR